MRNMYHTRKTLQLTQEKLSELTGIAQSALSRLERGKYKANQMTRQKIEEVLGKIDWLETTGRINTKNPNYGEAEMLIHKLVSITATMDGTDKKAVNELIQKYFKQ